MKSILPIIAIVSLMAMLAVAIYSDSVSDTGSGDYDDSLDGDWKQAKSLGLFNGSVVTDTYERNSITLNEGENNLISGNMRGYDFCGFRADRALVWEFSSSTGYSYVYASMERGAIIVNEVHHGTGYNQQMFVSTSVYTRDGSVPDWFGFWESPDVAERWVAHSMFSFNNSGSYELSGSNFYILDLQGPIFKAEMEQIVGDDVITRQLEGVFIDIGDDFATAFVTDSKGNNWHLYITDRIASLSIIMNSELEEIEGQAVVVQRTYMMPNDSSLPELPSSPDMAGTEWRMSEAYTVFSDGSTVERVGDYSVSFDSQNGTAFAGHGQYGETSYVELGFTVKTDSVPGGYRAYLATEHPDGMLDSSYGWFSEDLEHMHIASFSKDIYGNIVMNYTILDRM